MDRKNLLKHLVILMFFMFLADLVAKKFFWYSLIPYFDNIMHFLGGFWVGAFFLYAFTIKNLNPKTLKLFKRVFISTLVVGILWEVFEYIVFNVIGATSFDMGDTLLDIVFDMSGSLVAMFYFLKFIMIDELNKVE